jgi:hypothetical protein
MSIGNTYSTSDLRPTIKWHMAKMLLEQNFDLVGIPATETSLVDLLQFELHMKIC